MDCSYNNFSFTANNIKQDNIYSPPSFLSQLDHSELENKMIDLWASCKAAPSLVRSQRQFILECLSIAEAKQSLSPSLERMIKKLRKLVEGVGEESALLQIPPRLTILPLEAYGTTHYFKDYIKWNLGTIAPLLGIPFPIQQKLLLGLGDKECQARHIRQLSGMLEALPPQEYGAFRLFIEAAVYHTLERERIEKEIKGKGAPFALLDTEFEENRQKIEELYRMDRKELDSLHRERIRFLHQTRLLREKKEKKIAIIGAGPAGLMRGLLAIYLRFEIKIIEKRNASYSQTEGRPNILLLGHHVPDDLYPLVYFGVFDRLILEGVIKKSEYAGFEVAICDLERAMAEIVKELQPDALIPSVDNLQIKSHALEKTTLFYQEESFSADLVILCDGAKSVVGKQLGLTQTILSKKMNAPIGFFSPEENLFSQTIHTVLAASSLAFSGLSSWMTTQSSQEVIKTIRKKGILFRNKTLDYVGIPLTTEEAAFLKALPKEEREKILAGKLQSHHREMDLALSIFNPVHHVVRAGRLIEQRLVPIQLKKGETPVFTMGKSVFLVRGDAHGTTHPAAGYGAKTALSSLSADLQLLLFFEKGGANPILLEMFRRKAENSLYLSQSQGIEAIQTYLSDYEKPALFVEEIHKLSDYPQFAHLNLSMISHYFYLQKGRALSSQEEQALRHLKQEIVESWIWFSSPSSLYQETSEKFKTQHTFPTQLFQMALSPYLEGVEEVVKAIDPFPFHPVSANGEKILLSAAKQLFTGSQKPLGAFLGLLGWIEKLLSGSVEK